MNITIDVGPHFINLMANIGWFIFFMAVLNGISDHKSK